MGIRSLAASIAVVFAVPALLAAGPAAAASPCAAAVISDWRDGHIDRTYTPRCYRQALSALPEDMRIYSSAELDINRALRASLARTSSAVNGGKADAVKSVVRRLLGRTSKVAAQRGSAAREAAADPAASTVPIPVLVAGAAGVLLVATASISVAARRLRRAFRTD